MKFEYEKRGYYFSEKQVLNEEERREIIENLTFDRKSGIKDGAVENIVGKIGALVIVLGVLFTIIFGLLHEIAGAVAAFGAVWLVLGILMFLFDSFEAEESLFGRKSTGGLIFGIGAIIEIGVIVFCKTKNDKYIAMCGCGIFMLVGIMMVAVYLKYVLERTGNFQPAECIGYMWKVKNPSASYKILVASPVFSYEYNGETLTAFDSRCYEPQPTLAFGKTYDISVSKKDPYTIKAAPVGDQKKSSELPVFIMGMVFACTGLIGVLLSNELNTVDEKITYTLTDEYIASEYGITGSEWHIDCYTIMDKQYDEKTECWSIELSDGSKKLFSSKKVADSYEVGKMVFYIIDDNTFEIIAAVNGENCVYVGERPIEFHGPEN